MGIKYHVEYMPNVHCCKLILELIFRFRAVKPLRAIGVTIEKFVKIVINVVTNFFPYQLEYKVTTQQICFDKLLNIVCANNVLGLLSEIL